MQRMSRVVLVAVGLLSILAGPSPAAVWSVDTSRMSLAELLVLQGRPEIADWTELGDRLLVAGGEKAAAMAAAMAAPRVSGLADLEGLHVVLSKHHGVDRILKRGARVVAKEGPYHVIRASVPVLNRILEEEDFRLKVVPLRSHQVVFRSPAHLAEVPPPHPRIAALVEQVSRASYEATLKKLIAFKTRYSYSPGIQEAARWTVETFKASGLEAKIVSYPRGGRQLPNVVAELKGSTRPDDVYVVGAHLDSIAYDSQTYAPGADDNGSGSAGVLEMARVLGKQKPAATVRFVLFSGEEQGLYGSIAYVSQLEQSGDLAKVKAMINLDMVAFDQTLPVDVMLEGKAISHALSDRLQACATAFAPALKVYRTDDAWGSDHVSFLDKNVPATLTIEYEYDNNRNEHSPKDVFEICNLDLALQIVRMDVGALAELAGF